MLTEVIFWICFVLIVYTYAGYTAVLISVSLISKLIPSKKLAAWDKLPTVSLLIAAYNEYDSLKEKIKNTNSIDYPEDKLRIIWITDGSDDGSESYLRQNTGHTVLHQEEREGKTCAINRGMEHVDTEFVIFTDANTMINSAAIRNIIHMFSDPKTGCVSGEKRVTVSKNDNAVGSGEGIYWKYESFIKRMESSVSSSIGSAGELFGIRRELFTPVNKDIINDDFHISIQIIRKGYRIKYCPNAYAIEKPSFNVYEEKKRKVRIAAGGIQTMVKSWDILNPFIYGFFSLQYFSHKVLRWAFISISFILLFFTNLIIVSKKGYTLDVYSFLFMLQLIFYIFVFFGWIFQNLKVRFKIFFLPYYLWIINLSSLQGIIRYFRGKQSSTWEKSERMT